MPWIEGLLITELAAIFILAVTEAKLWSRARARVPVKVKSERKRGPDTWTS